MELHKLSSTAAMSSNKVKYMLLSLMLPIITACVLNFSLGEIKLMFAEKNLGIIWLDASGSLAYEEGDLSKEFALYKKDGKCFIGRVTFTMAIPAAPTIETDLFGETYPVPDDRNIFEELQVGVLPMGVCDSLYRDDDGNIKLHPAAANVAKLIGMSKTHNSGAVTESLYHMREITEYTKVKIADIKAKFPATISKDVVVDDAEIEEGAF